jgi:hypothetical protein
MLEKLKIILEQIKEMEAALASLKDRHKVLAPIILSVLNIAKGTKGTLVELKKNAVMVERAGII